MWRKKVTIATFLAIGLTVGLMLGGVFTTTQSGMADPAERQALEQELKDLSNFTAKWEQSFRKVSEYASPAVVYISSERVVEMERPQMPGPFGDEFFDRFFRGPENRQYRQRARGSGFIFDKEGYVLTNNHVVQKADELEVKLTDGRTFKAEIMGTDDATDLAVIKLKGDFNSLPTLDFGDSDNVDIGQWVIAIGNPFGLKHTVSAGIVSAKGRSIGIAQYESLIQTDAAINPGNSGGPLVNLNGKVVGINTAILSQSGGYMGIGFAIPSNMAKSVVSSLKKGEEVVRGFLGIHGKPLTPELAREFGLESSEGALVDNVIEGSPASKAEPVDAPDVEPGLKPGDIILEWAGDEIKDFQDLRLKVAGIQPGETARVKVWRNDKSITFNVKVERRSQMAMAGDNWLGIRVQTLTDEIKRQLGKDLKGVLVSDVEPSSPAAEHISPGDVILSINHERVESVEAYGKLVAATSQRKRALVRFYDADRGYAQFVLIQ